MVWKKRKQTIVVTQGTFKKDVHDSNYAHPAKRRDARKY